jgi:hypothetical protein
MLNTCWAYVPLANASVGQRDILTELYYGTNSERKRQNDKPFVDGDRMTKNVISLVLLITLLLTIVACASQASESSPESLAGPVQINAPAPAPERNVDLWIRTSANELLHMSTDIIRAEVLDSREELINTLLGDINLENDIAQHFVKPHIVYSLKVIEVFKGNVNVGDVIEVMQENDFSLLSLDMGSDLIFFLRNFEAYDFGHLPMAIEAGNQGFYRISSTDAATFSEGIKTAYLEDPSVSDILLENLCPYNNLILTIGDLMQIAGVASIDWEG